MCLYVTMLLPKGVNPDSVAHASGRGDSAFPPIENGAIQSQARPGDHYFRANRAICDCGTPLGAALRTAERIPLDEAEAASRLRKKGWGEARIARWLAEKRQAQAQQDAKVATRSEAAAGYAEFWVRFLHSALTSGYTPRITLLLHWYRSGVETEYFPDLPQETIPLSQVNSVFLAHLHEDILYNFVLD